MKEHRRARFKALLEGSPYNGNRALFMRHTGLTKGRISQLLDPNEPFGDAAARNLVRRLGLPADYFDRPEPSTDSLAAKVADAIRGAEPDRLEKFLQVVELFFGGNKEDRPVDIDITDPKLPHKGGTDTGLGELDHKPKKENKR